MKLVNWIWGSSVILILAGCGRENPEAAGPPPAKVTVAEPLKREIVEWDEYTGRLEAPAVVEIRPQVSGYLQSIHFQDGQMVQKGDLLFVIDPRPYEAEVQRARAALQQAEVQLTLAQNNFTRAMALRKKGVVAAEDYDSRENDFKVAQAGLAQAQATLATAELNLGFTRVTSPVTGRVGRYQVSEGNLVSGGLGGNATLLTTVVSLDPLYAYFDVDERSYLKYRNGAGGLGTERPASGIPDGRIEMRVANETGFPHQGRLNFVDNRVDTSTSTIQLRGEFSNAAMKLTPGLFAQVRIPVREKYTATLIPDQAVVTDQSREYVYVLDGENRAQIRPLILGPLHDGLRVVREGVSDGERLIVDGLMRVRPGAVVDPEEVSTATFIGEETEIPVAPIGESREDVKQP